MSLLTLFTDASYCPKTHAAGWGGWAKREDQPSKFMSGGLRQNIHDSNDAEIAALYLAVRELAHCAMLDNLEAVMLQSDSSAALGMFMGVCPAAKQSKHKDGAVIFKVAEPSVKPVILDCLTRTRDILLGKNLRVMVRHVRGHQHGEGRQWVNRRCDGMAKREMRTIRDEILNPVSLPPWDPPRIEAEA